MSKNKKHPKKNDQLRFENEFLKAKLTMEHGAKFFKSENNLELPPEVENEFLNNMILMKNPIEVTLYEFLGNPDFPDETSLDDKKLINELKRLTKLMLKHNVVCDVIAGVEDRTFYKFLTEELFLKTVNKLKVPGFTMHFIYEEFHPNNQYDTNKRCNEFLDIFFSEDYKEKIQYTFINENEVERLFMFRELFIEMQNVSYEVISYDRVEDICTRNVKVSYDGIVDRGTAPIHFDGLWSIVLECDSNWWTIERVNIPTE